MEKISDKILGTIFLLKDYIKKVQDKEDNIAYKQSNTKLPGYADRNIGICKFNNKIMVAVAINYNPKKDSDKTAKYVIKQRLHKILQNQFDILPSDDGFTYVPKEYTDYLWKDPHTFKNLHGLIDPTYAQMIINNL